MMLRELKQLMSHMQWADALVWRAVLALPGAGDDERVQELLYHVHSVHWAYLHLWRAEPVRIPEAATFGDPEALHGWARDYYVTLEGFLATLDEEALGRPVEFPWAEALGERFGEARTASVRQSFLQIALHTSHHRGQINSRIRELGGEPPLTDFIAYVWEGEPEPDWRSAPG